MCIGLTTEGTAPGLYTLRAFTTWNTSTTPSVLQRSMVVAMEQYIPERVAVSLGEKEGSVKSDECVICNGVECDAYRQWTRIDLFPVLL